MSNVDNLLSRLDKVRPTGQGTYQARCPAHDDRGPSLTIRETDDGKVLIHCFSGCSVYEVVGAIGLEISDLFPPRDSTSNPQRAPFPALAALRAVAFEAMVVAAAGSAMLAGSPMSSVDRERLIVAVSRIQSALSAVNLIVRGERHA